MSYLITLGNYDATVDDVLAVVGARRDASGFHDQVGEFDEIVTLHWPPRRPALQLVEIDLTYHAPETRQTEDLAILRMEEARGMTTVYAAMPEMRDRPDRTATYLRALYEGRIAEGLFPAEEALVRTYWLDYHALLTETTGTQWNDENLAKLRAVVRSWVAQEYHLRQKPTEEVGPAKKKPGGQHFECNALAIQRLNDGQPKEEVYKQWLIDYENERDRPAEFNDSGARELFRKSVWDKRRK